MDEAVTAGRIRFVFIDLERLGQAGREGGRCAEGREVLESMLVKLERFLSGGRARVEAKERCCFVRCAKSILYVVEQ